MKEFGTNVVMTLTTGRLLCDIGDLYEVLEHLTGRPVMTHELGVLTKVLMPYINEKFPELESIDVPDFSLSSSITPDEFISNILDIYGPTRGLEPVTTINWPSVVESLMATTWSTNGS